MFKNKLQHLLNLFLEDKDPQAIEKLVEEHTQSLARSMADDATQDMQQMATLPDRTIDFDSLHSFHITDDADTPYPDIQIRGGRRYRPQYQLGQGGMASVWKMLDEQLLRSVALKKLHPQNAQDPYEKENFLVEAQVTAQLQHPGIVPIHDLNILENGDIYFTMREIKGQTLHEIIKSVHRVSQNGSWEQTFDGWSLRRIIDILGDVCNTLAYAHDRGVIHQDLKPTNIMIGEYGEVLLVDWGIAKLHSLEEENEDWVSVHASPEFIERKRGSISGTPSYMAPEQLKGVYRKIDARSDIYALGIILFEVLSGEKAFAGSIKEIARQKKAPAPLLSRRLQQRIHSRAVPRELIDICEKAMHRDPEQRYQNAKELHQEIQSWLDGAQKEEKALRLLQEVDERKQQMLRIRKQISQLRVQIDQELHELGVEHPEPWENWEYLQSRYELLEEYEEDILSQLQGVMLQAPHLPDIYRHLIDVEYNDYLDAVANANHKQMKKVGKRIEMYLEQLSPEEMRHWKNRRSVDVASLQSQKSHGVSIPRYAVQAELLNQLMTHRWVSIVGLAGVGKTHSAWQVASEWCQRNNGQVFFCDMSKASTESEAIQEICATLNITLTVSDAIEMLNEVLKKIGSCVLIIDNAEGLPSSISTLFEQLLSHPHLHLLVTTRRAFGHPQEVSYRLTPMSLLEAIELFVQHCKKRLPNWKLQTENRKTISTIVQKLDQLPLAVQLASAHISDFNLSDLLNKLDLHFGSASNNNHYTKQSALKTALAWSCDLLSPNEFSLLTQLSIFPHRFTLNAAEEIISLANGANLTECLEVLIEDNLLIRENNMGVITYSMLKSIQEFALERLDPNLAQRLWHRHAQYFTKFYQEQASTPQITYQGELMNFILAVRHGNSHEANICCEAALKILAKYGPFGLATEVADSYLKREDISPRQKQSVILQKAKLLRHFGNGDDYLSTLLQLAPLIQIDDNIAETALTEIIDEGFFKPSAVPEDMQSADKDALFKQADLLEKQGLWDQALTFYKLLYNRALIQDHPNDQIRILHHIAQYYQQTSELNRALPFLQRLLVHHSQMNHTTELLNTMIDLAVVLFRIGQNKQAIEQYQQALQLASQLDSISSKARIIGNLGILHQAEGNLSEALSAYEQSQHLFKELGENAKVGALYGNMGTLYNLQGKYDSAVQCFEQAITIAKNEGQQAHYGVFLGNQAIALAKSNPQLNVENQLVEAISICDQYLPFAAGAFRGELALMYTHAGQFDEAKSLLNKGENQIQDSKEDYGQFLCKKSEAFYHQGHWTQSNEAFQKALQIAKELQAKPYSELQRQIKHLQKLLPAQLWLTPEVQEDMHFQARVIQEFGTQAYTSTQYPKAEHYFETALDMFYAIDAEAEQLETQHLLALLYSHSNRLTQAIDLDEKVRQAYKIRNDMDNYANVTNHLGGYFRQANNLKQALEYHQIALEYFEGHNQIKAISTYEKMGLCCLNLGEYERGSTYLASGLKMAKQYRVRSATLTCNLGLCHNVMGDFENALKYYHEGVQELHQIGDRNREATYLGNIANIYSRQERYDEAEQLYHRVIQMAINTNIKKHEGLFRGNFGDCLIKQKKYDEGISQLEQSLDLTKNNYPAAYFAFHHSLAVAYALSGNIQKGLELLQVESAESLSDYKEEYIKALAKSAEVYCHSQQFNIAAEFLHKAKEVQREMMFDEHTDAYEQYEHARQIFKQMTQKS